MKPFAFALPGPARDAFRFGFLLLACFLASCHKGGAPPAQPVVKLRTAPTLEQLRNATYQSVGEESTITLRAGHWEGTPYLGGSETRPSANLVSDFRLTGDVDGDGGEDAMVLLASRSGGTGENVYLALVQRSGGTVINTATVLIGDRVQIRDGGIHGGRVVLDVLQPGPTDAMCCPGELATRSWRYVPGGLREAASPDSIARLTFDALEGVEWVLRSWSPAEAAPREPRVTLRVADGILSGRAACNGYSARPRNGDMPGLFTTGPIATTRMACPDSVMKIESRYLDLLGRTRQFGFSAGRLVLPYEKDSVSAALIFERAAPPDTVRAAPPSASGAGGK
jgi:heat shock protein HslJ